MRRARTRLVLGVVAGTLLLSGCKFDVYQLPLPGGTDVGEDPIRVTVRFADVLDLVPKSTVKVNDVSVGMVTDINLDGYVAEAEIELRRDVVLPDNTQAQIRQTSLLGEKFVSLSAPEEASVGKLESGDVIELEDTGRNPEVEEVLGALSLVLNGGGVAQLKTITQELNKALEGREDSIRSVLTQIDTFVGTLDQGKADILDAIESLDRLAKSAQTQQDTIDDALRELPSALDALDAQRGDLVRMLEALTELSDVSVEVIRASKADTIANFRNLQPVLSEFARSGDAFAKAFHVFLTYPFVDEVVGRDPQVARNLHMGDYTNLDVQLDLDLSGGGLPTGLPTGPQTELPTELDPTVILNELQACIDSGSLTSRECRKVLDEGRITELKKRCQRPANRDTRVCRALNQVPGLPGGDHAPEAPHLPGGLDGLGGAVGGTLSGLNRPATGATEPAGGPTMGELMDYYDPGLVSLLVPGMVTR